MDQKNFTVNLQRIFGLALVLKVFFAFLGLMFQSPIILGAILPLTIMIAYMCVGYYKRPQDVTEEKFADSCYYIGFIFTIVSIIFCLFDVPKMTSGNGLVDIAYRFGTAMLSTVLGMGVRVYLVSFKQDANDAIRDVQATLIQSTKQFTLELQQTTERLRVLQTEVTEQTRMSVVSVQEQVKKLGQDFSESLNGFYTEINDRNDKVFKSLFDEVRDATTKLATAVESYTGGMKGHLGSIETKVEEFADAITDRLNKTTFPDDYFAKQLHAPLDHLSSQTHLLGDKVRGVSEQVTSSSETIVEVLRNIQSRTKKTKDVMDAVVNISESQRILLMGAESHVGSLGLLAAKLEEIDSTIKETQQLIGANSSSSSDLAAKVGSLTADSAQLRMEMNNAIAGLVERLGANADLAGQAVNTFEKNVSQLGGRTDSIVTALAGSTEASNRFTQQISTSLSEWKIIATSTTEAAAGLQHTADKTNEAASALVNTTTRASDLAGSIQSLDNVIRQHTDVLVHAADRLSSRNDTKVREIAQAVIKGLSEHFQETFPINAAAELGSSTQLEDNGLLIALSSLPSAEAADGAGAQSNSKQVNIL